MFASKTQTWTPVKKNMGTSLTKMGHILTTQIDTSLKQTWVPDQYNPMCFTSIIEVAAHRSPEQI